MVINKMTELKRKILNHLDPDYVKSDAETDRFFYDYIYGEYYNHIPKLYIVEVNFDCLRNPKRIWSMNIHDVNRDETTVLRSYAQMRMFFYTLVAHQQHDNVVGDLRFSYPDVEKILKEDNLMPEELRLESIKWSYD